MYRGVGDDSVLLGHIELMGPVETGCFDDFPSGFTSQILNVFQGNIFLDYEIIKQDLSSAHSSIITSYFLIRSVVGMLQKKLLCQSGSELNEHYASPKADCK